MVNAQEWLDKNYPQENRKNVKELNIGSSDINITLEGELDLTDFTNLEKLDCSGNRLTNLGLGNCSRLREIDCYHNK